MIMSLRLIKNYSRVSGQVNHIKRFYKESTFEDNHKKAHPSHNYLIKLDQKTLKTPYRHTLAVPTKILAFLICAQFNRQDKHIMSSQMPILSLCRTAVDADLQGNIAQHLKHSIFQYLKTDSLLFVDQNYQKHHSHIANPLIKHFQSNFSMKIPTSDSLNAPIFQISPNFINWVHSLNNWQLVGLETMTIWLKSTISAWSIIGKDIPVLEARRAVTLEQTIQMIQNGEVQQKIMDYNQIQLMASCGELMFRYGKSDK